MKNAYSSKNLKGRFLKMKVKLVFGILLVFGFGLTSCKSDGPGNKISLIAELPDTAEYVINGVFVDIGIVYNEFEVEDLSLYNYNKKWCLFNGDSYWVTTKEQLDEIAQKAGITLQSNMDLPFWDEWGGRIFFVGSIFCIIICLILWNKFRPKTKILQPFDGKLNKENAANLLIRACYKVKEYNGYKVNWASTIAAAASILLPPGKCSMVFDYSEKEEDTTHTAYNHKANGNLEAGKTYLIKSVRYKNWSGTTMVTSIVECKTEDMKAYLSGIYSPVITKELGTAKRVGENITKGNAQQFVNDFIRQIQNEGYRFVDQMGKNAEELYEEFRILDISIASGEVYCYKKPHWNLLISRGDESGIMLSFTDAK
jgi:hypothetical protein